MKPTKLAREVIEEIREATSLNALDEIKHRPLPWLDRDNTDDLVWILEEMDCAQKSLLDERMARRRARRM